MRWVRVFGPGLVDGRANIVEGVLGKVWDAEPRADDPGEWFGKGRTPATAFRMGWEWSSGIVMEPLRRRTQRSRERQNSMRSEGSSTIFSSSWTAACGRSIQAW